MTRLLAFSLTLTLALTSAVALAQGEGADPGTVQIQSEHLVIDTQAQTATFDGDVVVRHGDLHLRCEKLLADLDEDGKPTRVTATGHVKVSRGDLFATAGTVVYKQDTRELLLTGAPVLWKGGNKLAGQAVHIDLLKDTVEIDKPRGLMALPEHAPPATSAREEP